MNSLSKITPLFIFFILISAFLGEKIIPANGNFIGSLDIEYFFYHLLFIKKQILSGSIPLWNPYYFSGQPFLANPVNALCYPATLLFLIFHMPWAFSLDYFIHLFLAASGMYFFVNSLTKSQVSGIVSGIVFGLGGYFMNRLYAGHLTMFHAAALIPWIFYFIEQGYQKKRLVIFAGAGLIFGLQILSGDPQDSYYTGLFFSIYYFFRCIFSLETFSFRFFLRHCSYYSIIPIVAFGISAVQILPTLEFIPLCDRALNSYEFSTYLSFPPSAFFCFLVPTPQQTSFIIYEGELAGYFGIFAIMLSFIGAFYTKQRNLILTFGIMLFFVCTIMLGSYTPIYKIYYKYLPFISTFRIPGRCVLMFSFVMSVLAGLGVKVLCELSLTDRQFNMTFFFGILILVSLLIVTYISQIPFSSKEIFIAIMLSIHALIVLIIIRFMKNKTHISVILVYAVFIDLFIVYHQYLPVVDEKKYLTQKDYETIFENDRGYYRVNFPIGNLRGLNFEYFNLNGYTTIVLKDYYNFIHHMAGIPVPELRRHEFDSTLFHRDKVFTSKIFGVKYAGAFEREGEYRFISTTPKLPRAVLVDNFKILPHLEDHIEYIKKNDFDPKKIVLLESFPEEYKINFFKLNQKAGKKGTVEIVRYEPNRIELKSETQNSTFLLLSELFYPGWYAYANGKEIPIVRADYLLRAIPLEPGKYDIVFVYRPLSAMAGASISVVTLILIALYGVIQIRNKFF